MRKWIAASSALLIGTLAACTDDPPAPGAGDATATGKTSSAMTTVHGTFKEKSVGLDNARVVAITDDRTEYWSYLDAEGRFTLKLPVGCSYRIVFANQLEGGGQVKIAHLEFKAGAKISQWFGANAEAEVNLGTVSATADIDGEVDADVGVNDDCSCQKDESRKIGGSVEGSVQAKVEGSVSAANLCLVWPSLAVHAAASVDASFADLQAEAHAEASVSIERDDDKNCAHWTDDEGSVQWGAPWRIEADGTVIVSGGFEIDVDVEAEAELGFEFGLGAYGGFGAGAGASANAGGSANANAGAEASGGFGIGFGISFGGKASASAGGEANVSVAGIVSGSAVVEGWATGSVGIGVQGTACVTAGSCGDSLCCVAGKCQDRDD